MSQHRWMKFWPQDFESDPALKMCSLAAQGLWVRMICRMHEGSPYGHLTIAQRPITPQKLAILIGLPVDKLQELLRELQEHEVFSETADGVIFSRRMVRDGEQSEAGRAAAKWRWRNERFRNGPGDGEGNATPNRPPIRVTNGDPNTKEAETESDTPQSAALGKSTQNDRKRGTRLPDDWQPSEADSKYAEGLGLDVRRVAEDFRCYWLSKAGKDATKVDWSLTWQGWCRREADRRGKRPATGSGQSDLRHMMGSCN
jgi:hypothetical protein